MASDWTEMKRIHVLTTDDTPNSLAFNFPLQFNKRMLKAFGLDVRLFFKITKPVFECDVLFVNSKCFRLTGQEKQQEFLADAKERVDVVLWFDTTDSTGTTQFEVMPYVEGYYKSQALRDRRWYLKEYYRNRIFIDYYHTHFGLHDDGPYDRFQPALEKDLAKIHVSWSSALGDYGVRAKYYDKARKYLPLPYRYSAQFVPPEKDRAVDITCRVGLTHRSSIVRHHREMIVTILAQTYGVSSEKIARKKFFEELQNAKIAISPFGWGEITLRDFEIIINGAALFKPDLSHMETWPPLFVEHETYVPHRWDMSDFVEKLDHLLSSSEYTEIAQNAQQVYHQYLFERKGHEEFCKRVSQIVEQYV